MKCREGGGEINASAFDVIFISARGRVRADSLIRVGFI
jgi:hypothetical protein